MFKGTTVPKLPAGFVDLSYINNVCSHWEKQWNEYIIEIWIAHDDIDRREALFQYSICIRKENECEFEELIEFNVEDFTEEGMKEASRKIYKAVWKLMKKYY